MDMSGLNQYEDKAAIPEDASEELSVGQFRPHPEDDSENEFVKNNTSIGYLSDT